MLVAQELLEGVGELSGSSHDTGASSVCHGSDGTSALPENTETLHA